MTLTEEQRGTVAFDMEKARADLITANKPTYDYHEATARCIKTHMPEALAEIERLRAENLKLRAAILGPDSIRAHQAARIKELESLVESSMSLVGCHQRVIEKLEKALEEERARCIELGRAASTGRFKPVPPLQESKELARRQLQREGKIGIEHHIVETDQMVPNGKVWQITEERKETLRRALEEYKIFPNDQAVLRAMLKEAL